MEQMTVKFKKIRKGVYETTTDSKPKKVDSDRVRQIIDREPAKRQRRDDPTGMPQPAGAQVG